MWARGQAYQGAPGEAPPAWWWSALIAVLPSWRGSGCAGRNRGLFRVVVLHQLPARGRPSSPVERFSNQSPNGFSTWRLITLLCRPFIDRCQVLRTKPDPVFTQKANGGPSPPVAMPVAKRVEAIGYMRASSSIGAMTPRSKAPTRSPRALAFVARLRYVCVTGCILLRLDSVVP
jgi:hypothetical protein